MTVQQFKTVPWVQGLFWSAVSGGMNAVVLAVIDPEHLLKVGGLAFLLGASKRMKRYLDETEAMWHPGKPDRRSRSEEEE